MARVTNRTFEYVKVITEQFGNRLGRIARQLAEHERAEYVLQRHVDEAFEAMSRTGLNRRPWWQRPESLVAAGVGVFGLANSCPDFIGGLLPEFAAKATLIRVLMILFIGVGAALITFGFLRGAGNFARQQDRSGAGAEDGTPPAELTQRLHQVLLAQQLEHGGALAARDDQAVQTFQVGCGANFHDGGSGARGRFGMRVEIALQR